MTLNVESSPSSIKWWVFVSQVSSSPPDSDMYPHEKWIYLEGKIRIKQWKAMYDERYRSQHERNPSERDASVFIHGSVHAFVKSAYSSFIWQCSPSSVVLPSFHRPPTLRRVIRTKLVPLPYHHPYIVFVPASYHTRGAFSSPFNASLASEVHVHVHVVR